MPNRRVSEAASPERRGFILLLGVVNALFTIVEALSGGHVTALAARVVLTVLLLAAPVLLARPLSVAAAHALVRGLGAVAALAFADIAWSTGGATSTYLSFLPMVPLVFTMAVPDDPPGSLVCGLVAAASGLFIVHAGAPTAAQVAFWVLAFGSTTTYAVAATIFFNRQKTREERFLSERARAVEILTDSERGRARAERLALVGRLAGGVAHDVANPLAAVRANLAAIAERAFGERGPDPDTAEALADARAALDRIQRTVEDLRAFSREASSEPEDCRVPSLVAEALRLLEQRFVAAARVEQALPSDLPVVRADPDRVIRALLWILVDAADALDPPAGPRAASPARTVRIAARAERGEVVIAVEDDGADLDAARAFEPFGGGARGGGLALALAREDLARDGGAVEASRAPGGGARYLVRLPVAGEPCGVGVGSGAGPGEPPAR